MLVRLQARGEDKDPKVTAAITPPQWQRYMHAIIPDFSNGLGISDEGHWLDYGYAHRLATNEVAPALAV